MVALLCAVTAAAILMFAMSKYRHAVANGAKQDTVLVATSEILKGTASGLIGSQHMYKITPVLASQVSAGAIVNAAALSGQYAASNILPGQQLTSADFTASGGGISAQLTATERAVSLTLDGAHGLAGALQSGDHVDIYGSFSGQAGGTDNVVSLVVPNAVVLKAPGAAGGGAGQGGTVLLGVGDQLAPKVMWVSDYGKVWLVLRAASSSNPAATVTGVYDVMAGNHATATVNGVSGTLTYTTPSTKRTKP